MHHLSRTAQRWAKSLIHPSSSSPSAPAVAAAESAAPLFSQYLKEFRRGISTSSFNLRAAGGDSGDKDGDDADADEDEKPKRGRRKIEITDEDIAVEPMDYIFAGVPPDYKAPRLSDESKEKIWRAYCDNPTDEMIDKLSENFKIRKQRLHAILWLKEIEKKEETERGVHLEDDIERAFEQIHGSYEKADNERHYTLPRTAPDFTVQSEGWEGSVKAEGQNIDEVSAKEEHMMVQEFERRMAFNKLQIQGLIKNDKLSRTRPAGGWSYLIEELGEAGKRGRRGGRRFVAQPDGSHRGLNDIEKMFLKRETVRPRRRLTPK
ncbi:hypothetical protein R1sor_004521 [Riccia sorocarpa]|uniref:Uncharacterized protein n=1 Tax=Riccia sorocarpa TaxID=122646 RepID=A0ABD3HGY8_9MARC